MSKVDYRNKVLPMVLLTALFFQ